MTKVREQDSAGTAGSAPAPAVSDEFPQRIVLGEGYPWAYGEGPYFGVGLSETQVEHTRKRLKWLKNLWSQNVPRYRLVLERVEE